MRAELRRFVLTFAAGAALALFMWVPLHGQAGGGKIKVVLSPTGKDRGIHRALSEEIDSARKDIRIMLYQFTSRDLMNRLRNMKSKARIRVLLDAEQAKRVGISVHEELTKMGIDVRFVDLPGHGPEAAKFHHKVLIVDDQVVATGSYNWSVLADEENHENIVILRDVPTARTFLAEFDRIWESAKEGM